MKKLLSAVTAFGLIATTSTSIVSCGTQLNKNSFLKLNTYEVNVQRYGDDREIIEIMNFENKMVEYYKNLSKFLWKNHEISDVKTSLELEYISGITNINVNFLRNESNTWSKLITVQANDTVGKSSWAINLYSYSESSPNYIIYEVPSVYFDVNVK